MKPDPFKLLLLVLGWISGMFLYRKFGAAFEDAAYVLLAISTIWVLIDMYRKGPSYG